MAQLESYAHLECIINGFRFSGWADEDPPFEFDFEESSERTRGADGGLYALGMPTYGGTWTFKVFPTAPPAQWAMQNEQMRKDAHKDGSPERTIPAPSATPVLASVTAWTAALSSSFRRWLSPARPTKG